MDSVLTLPRDADEFLAWENRQEGKHEFDGTRVIPMTGGSLAHQRIVLNLCFVLMRLLADRPYQAAQEMRLRIGDRVRYPDVTVFAGPLDQTTKTLSDAIAIFEVSSDETGSTDRVFKLRDYTDVPSLRCYAIVEQGGIAATVYRRESGGPWIASAHLDGEFALPGLDVSLKLAELYAGLTFPAAPGT